MYQFIASAREGKGSDIAHDQEKVQEIIEQDKAFFKQASAKAAKALSGIHDFWTQIMGHEGAVSREMMALDNYLLTTKGLPAFNYAMFPTDIYTCSGRNYPDPQCQRVEGSYRGPGDGMTSRGTPFL